MVTGTEMSDEHKDFGYAVSYLILTFPLYVVGTEYSMKSCFWKLKNRSDALLTLASALLKMHKYVADIPVAKPTEVI